MIRLSVIHLLDYVLFSNHYSNILKEEELMQEGGEEEVNLIMDQLGHPILLDRIISPMQDIIMIWSSNLFLAFSSIHTRLSLILYRKELDSLM